MLFGVSQDSGRSPSRAPNADTLRSSFEERCDVLLNHNGDLRSLRREHGHFKRLVGRIVPQRRSELSLGAAPLPHIGVLKRAQNDTRAVE